jgi:hypothetical protein
VAGTQLGVHGTGPVGVLGQGQGGPGGEFTSDGNLDAQIHVQPHPIANPGVAVNVPAQEFAKISSLPVSGRAGDFYLGTFTIAEPAGPPITRCALWLCVSSSGPQGRPAADGARFCWATRFPVAPWACRTPTPGYRWKPDSVQRWNTPAFSAGHSPSLGTEPSRNRARISATCSRRPAVGHRANANDMDVQSCPRNSGLMCAWELTVSSGPGCQIDEASTRIQGRSPFRPSHHLWHPVGTGALGLSLSFAPGRYQPRTPGQGRVWNTDPKSRLRHHAEPPIDETHSQPATSCRTVRICRTGPGHGYGARSRRSRG